MTEASGGVRDIVMALEAARDGLARQLAGHEQWLALRQLDEREARGETIDGLDSSKLRSYLEGELDRTRPGWRAWLAVGDALRHASAWESETTPASTALNGIIPKAPAAAASVANNGFDAGASARVRVKIKAGSATLNDAAPVDGPIKPEVAAATVQAARAAGQPEKPDLSRIRNVATAASQHRRGDDRFGGAVPWAKLGSPPPAPSEPVRPVPQPATPRPLVAPGPALHVPPPLPLINASPTAAQPTASPPRLAGGAVDRPVAVQGGGGRGFAAGALPADVRPVRPPLPAEIGTRYAIPAPSRMSGTDSSGEERLKRLESDLGEVVGRPKEAQAVEPAVLDKVWLQKDLDAADSDLDVEEADVEIVPLRPELDEPLPKAATHEHAAGRPVALSIRLKERAHAAEFDSDDYAAYHDDVGEADVEIIRPAVTAGAAPARGQDRLAAPATRVGADQPPADGAGITGKSRRGE